MKTCLLLSTIIACGLSSFNVSATLRYVDVSNPNPTSPYTNWATAATTIQDAANVAGGGDTILVTNGIYQTGGNAATGRIYIHPSINVQSVNGPAMTIINGSGVMRCALLSSGVTLSGFTLANGAALTHSGGGVSCLTADAVVVNCIFTNNSGISGGGAQSGTYSNCTFVGNIATNYGGGVYGGTNYQCSFVSNSAGVYGGGAFQSTLVNCSLTGNSLRSSSGFSGGGAYSSILTNCAVIGNRTGYIGGGAGASILVNCTVASNSAAGYSGGIDSGMLNNCILYYNSPDNYNIGGSFTNCCIFPLPAVGANNITNPPAFVDPAGGNFRLQSNSPCINAGNNSYVTNSTDLDGNPRIVGGTVDMGAYECQSPALLAYYTWLQGYGLSTDASLVYTNSDSDGPNNWQEYLADTSPLDANDFLHITNFTRSGTYNTLWWTSKSTRLYRVQRCETLDGASPWEIIITNAAPGWNNVGFDNMGPQYFYRIQAVQP